ncbi:TrkH family potassium uptake protein [Thermoanaerobacterium sp. RBIITD]|uniref:TrkH family potassium uptake protein n=1 Tax=Thermoanaerobacterium sp. RBIITD TaxID=1550240 RepID=UPI000BB96545|nr:TrkH family potassium uptake protein [Thermoanaerobacterium sp. RBIITD]SNX52951.1 trk system potassium uptake protein TrkH [Thermoanaerobacterium sp. RBIITD]
MNSFIEDFKIVNYYSAKIIEGMAYVMAIPFITAIFYKEWNTAVDFALSFMISMIVGLMLEIFCKDHKKDVRWLHGMLITGYAWLMLTVLDAVPYWLSGHYGSFLDASFDVMSGFTTTGLVLIQDLDHISNGINMWRHLLTFIGGQGMVVMTLSFLVGLKGAYMMYVGEGKDEKLLPNVKHTARAIWGISIVYLIIGTLALTIAGIIIGLSPIRSFLDGLWVYMAAWSTGGFAPHSQNILYYHSMLYEVIGIIIFVIGSFNFALHYSIWTGNKKEIYKNIETVSFFTTVMITFIILTAGLIKNNIYPNAVIMFRKGFYQLISAHTTTGFMTLYANQISTDWGTLAILAMVIAMLIGGSACSTAGGFKGMRVGIIFKSFIYEIKKLFMPEKAISVEKYHNHGEIRLDDETVRKAMFIVLCYIVTFTIGVLFTTYFGYPLEKAAYEVASVTGNVGLSIGITQPSMPNTLKAVYILIMWAGRLEFMAVFAILGYVVSGVRKIWQKD